MVASTPYVDALAECGIRFDQTAFPRTNDPQLLRPCCQDWTPMGTVS